MDFKNILKLLLIIVFITGTLNFAYANGGPIVGENQAKKSAQSYLDSNNLSYTAVTPGWDDLKVEIIDPKTLGKKWIAASLTEGDKYIVTDYWPTWIVQVTDKNGKNVGQIYVDANIGEVMKVIIDGKVLKDVLNQREKLMADSYKSTNENLSESSIDENISETYEPDVITTVMGIIYPLIYIPPVLFGNSIGASVFIIILMLSGMYIG